MHSRVVKISLLLSIGLASLVSALPVDRDLQSIYRRKQKSASASGAATDTNGLPAVGSGPATATDGSTIVEKEVVINGLNMRFKVSAPSSELVAAGAAAGAGARAGNLGINVLFHGDGGQSFFDFPNQGVNNNLMGVALLSPDPQLRWGGSDPNDNTGLVRPDGAAHSTAVNQLLTQVLPQVVNFDPTQVFMEGVSGGSLLLSGFMLPAFGASLGVPGAVIGCGGLPPQVAVQGDISNIRIHWQSTVNDLPDLQTSIPQAITAYEKLATDAGLSTTQINQLQTADASPNGGHCEFDEKDFVSGVQLLSDNFGQILAGNAALNGVTVTNGVVGNENLFSGNANNQASGAATANSATQGNISKTSAGQTGSQTGGRKKSVQQNRN